MGGAIAVALGGAITGFVLLGAIWFQLLIAVATGLRRRITQHQGWLFFPLLTLEGLNLHFHSFKHLFGRGPVRGRWIEMSIIRGGWWATWLMGGLNYQVEHHLFPNMARPHLAKAREIVREHCEKLGVPYTETSLARSYWIVIQYLNRVGLSARDPFDCPITAEYRRG